MMEERMVKRFSAFSIFFLLLEMNICAQCSSIDGELGDRHKPAVLLVILARNKAHTLPQYLGFIDNLDYPKDRISLWVRADHSIDNTSAVLREWVNGAGPLYHSYDMRFDDSPSFFADEIGPMDWPESRYYHIINLREEALNAARRMWADYAFFVDSDNFLEYEDTLNELIKQKRLLVAPMLESSTAFSNFWCGQDENGYYKRTEEYLPTLQRERLGCFHVPMIHSTFLIDLRQRKSDSLTFNPNKLKDYKHAVDDIIIFAQSARDAGIPMYICNHKEFGHMSVPRQPRETLEYDEECFANLKLDAMTQYSQWEYRWNKTRKHYGEAEPMLVSKYVTVPEKTKDSLGFDKVFLINLLRRPFRRRRMLASLAELRVDAAIVDATDGKQLNESWLQQAGIQQLLGYEDPYHHRPMTMGEIGCFHSHYRVWQEVVDKGYRNVLIFEDDVRFEHFFRRKLDALMMEAKQMRLDWDLIYLGRKVMDNSDEQWVEGMTTMCHPDYSYWTLSYALTNRGARKLLAQKPLQKMVPVDEYLPIMFNKHPTSEWKHPFSPRDLRAYSAAPLLVHPTHYTKEQNYISDTEDSIVINTDEFGGVPAVPSGGPHTVDKHGEL